MRLVETEVQKKKKKISRMTAHIANLGQIFMYWTISLFPC